MEYSSWDFISELAIVYIALEGATLLLLLVGGTKSSQTKDIKLAKEIYESWRRDHE